MKIWGKFLAAAVAPLMLGGCLWGPGRFTSSLALNKAGTFVFDYRGEILLQLPDNVRTKYDVSSLRLAIHAAAPCPPDVKQAMIDWWGPILLEYYGGTEVNGLTYITSEEWLAHRGSVGKAVLGTIHICDESGAELPGPSRVAPSG